jgi:hypothetical protein
MDLGTISNDKIVAIIAPTQSVLIAFLELVQLLPQLICTIRKFA